MTNNKERTGIKQHPSQPTNKENKMSIKQSNKLIEMTRMDTHPIKAKPRQPTHASEPATYCVEVTIWCWQNWHVVETGTSRNCWPTTCCKKQRAVCQESSRIKAIDTHHSHGFCENDNVSTEQESIYVL